MRKVTPALATAAVLLLLLAAPTFAAGPDDGVWQIQQFNPSFGTLTFFASIHQNDGFLSAGFNVLVAVLSANGTWDYGLGLRSGQTVQGTLYFPSGALYGTFNVTLVGANLNGSAFIQGYPFTLSGQKVF